MPRLPTFTQNELILLTQTHAGLQLYAHEIEDGHDRGWELRIQFSDKTTKRVQTMTLATARGNVRLFKNLDTVIEYVKVHAKRFDEFAVYFGNRAVRRI